MTPEQKKGKKSILQIIIGYLKEQPATEEEIKQLRLEAEKYRLKADIARSKARISHSKEKKFSQGSFSSRKFDYSHSDAEDRVSGLLRDTVGAKEVDLFRNNDGKSDKEIEAYRKRVLGL